MNIFRTSEVKHRNISLYIHCLYYLITRGNARNEASITCFTIQSPFKKINEHNMEQEVTKHQEKKNKKTKERNPCKSYQTTPKQISISNIHPPLPPKPHIYPQIHLQINPAPNTSVFNLLVPFATSSPKISLYHPHLPPSSADLDLDRSIQKTTISHPSNTIAPATRRAPRITFIVFPKLKRPRKRKKESTLISRTVQRES